MFYYIMMGIGCNTQQQVTVSQKPESSIGQNKVRTVFLRPDPLLHDKDGLLILGNQYP